MAESPHNCGVKVVYPALGGKCSGLNMYFVYILKSQKPERFYVGCTSNLKRRIDEHNLGKVVSTKAYAPWSLIYVENYSSRTTAFEREKQIKSYKGGRAFKSLINNSERWQSG